MQIALQRIFITSTQHGSRSGLPDPCLCRLDLDSLLPDGTAPNLPPRKVCFGFSQSWVIPSSEGPEVWWLLSTCFHTLWTTRSHCNQRSLVNSSLNGHILSDHPVTVTYWWKGWPADWLTDSWIPGPRGPPPVTGGAMAETTRETPEPALSVVLKGHKHSLMPCLFLPESVLFCPQDF